MLFRSDVCKQAVDYALQIRAAFEAKGVQMFGTSMTNQQFPILSEAQMAVFDGKFAYEYWGRYDDSHHIVRFCTSWATKQENMDALLKAIKDM